MHLSEKILNNLIQRITSAVQPRSIILFGSAGRGEMRENSDIDILVIMPDGVHRRSVAQLIYRSLQGFGFAKDVVVVTQTDVENYRHSPGLIIRTAINQGKEIYHAP